MGEFGTYPPKANDEDWNALLDHGLMKEADKICRINGGKYEVVNGKTGKLDFGPSEDQALTLNWAFSHLTAGRTWLEKVLILGDWNALKAKLVYYNKTMIELRGNLKAHLDLGNNPMLEGDQWLANGNEDFWLFGGGVIDGNHQERGVLANGNILNLGCYKYHVFQLTLNYAPNDAIQIAKCGTGHSNGICAELGGWGMKRHGLNYQWGGDSIARDIGFLADATNTGYGLYVFCHGSSFFTNIHMSNFLSPFVFERGNNPDWGLAARCKNLYADTPKENALWLKTSGYADCANVEIDGFWVLGNSSKVDADYAYIRLTGAGGQYVRNCSIKGIRIAYVHDGTHQRYGIIEEGTVKNNIIEDAHFFNHTVALSNVNPLNAKVRRIYDGVADKWSENVLSTKNIVTGGSTIPHGLCFIPNKIQPLGNADARIWRHQVADATNIYLTSSADITADIAVGRD